MCYVRTVRTFAVPASNMNVRLLFVSSASFLIENLGIRDLLPLLYLGNPSTQVNCPTFTSSISLLFRHLCFIFTDLPNTQQSRFETKMKKHTEKKHRGFVLTLSSLNIDLHPEFSISTKILACLRISSWEVHASHKRGGKTTYEPWSSEDQSRRWDSTCVENGLKNRPKGFRRVRVGVTSFRMSSGATVRVRLIEEHPDTSNGSQR